MKKALKIIVLSLVALTIVVTTTQPAALPSLLLITPFLLIFLILTLVWALLLTRRGKGTWSKNIRSGMFAAALPLLLLVLQSLGQLTVRDVLIILVLFGIAYFYLLRTRAPAA